MKNTFTYPEPKELVVLVSGEVVMRGDMDMFSFIRETETRNGVPMYLPGASVQARVLNLRELHHEDKSFKGRVRDWQAERNPGCTTDPGDEELAKCIGVRLFSAVSHGEGCKAVVNGKVIRVGNREWVRMEMNRADIAIIEEIKLDDPEDLWPLRKRGHGMRITNIGVQVYRNTRNRVKGLGWVVLNGVLRLENFRIVNGKEGLYVEPPKSGEGQYAFPSVSFHNDDLGTDIARELLAEYKKVGGA